LFRASEPLGAGQHPYAVHVDTAGPKFLVTFDVIRAVLTAFRSIRNWPRR
jgi:hypothetical protein